MVVFSVDDEREKRRRRRKKTTPLDPLGRPRHMWPPTLIPTTVVAHESAMRAITRHREVFSPALIYLGTLALRRGSRLPVFLSAPFCRMPREMLSLQLTSIKQSRWLPYVDSVNGIAQGTTPCVRRDVGTSKQWAELFLMSLRLLGRILSWMQCRLLFSP